MGAYFLKKDQLVSIIVTAYNVGNYLEKCLDSVVGQTYRDIEVFIIDDGSTDNTEEIGKDFANKYSHVSYLYQENSGVSVARNYGIKSANGEFLMFVDGDDYLEPDIVSVLLEKMENDTDIACCCCKAFDDDIYVDNFFDKTYYMQTMQEKERLFLQLLNGNKGKPNGKGKTAIGVPWGKLYRAGLLKKNHIMFEPKLRRMQDNMFNMYTFYYAHKIIYLNEAHYNYRLEHIQNKNTLYSPELWRQLLLARKHFFEEHNEFITDAIKKEIFYEKNVALAVSIMFISKNMAYKEAKKEFTILKKDLLYHELFEKILTHRTPVKFMLLRSMLKMHCYYGLYCVFRKT